MTPDVAVPADQALQTAYVDALKKIEERSAKATGKPDGPGEPLMLAGEPARASSVFARNSRRPRQDRNRNLACRKSRWTSIASGQPSVTFGILNQFE